MSRPSVLLTRPLPTMLEERLRTACDVTGPLGEGPVSGAALAAACRDHGAILCQLTEPIDAGLLARPSLRLVAQVAVGLDNVDLDAARRYGIAVTHTPGVLTDATADLTMALILATARRLPEAQAFVRDGQWRHWSLDLLAGLELRGARLGIVGLGRIGGAVATRARAFGMEILHHTRGRPDSVPLDDLLAGSDVISVHVPLDGTTRNLLSRERLSRCKRGAIVLNTARGGIVDEDALADMLDAGQLGGIGLDVHRDEPRVHPRLLAHPRALLVPHIGSATARTRFRMAEMATESVIAWARGEAIPHRAV
jgi:glyoxylate reductase